MKNLKFLIFTILFFAVNYVFAQQKVVLNLNQAPELEATLMKADTSIILGTTITIGNNLNATGGSGSYSYTWTGDNTIGSPELKMTEVTPVDTTIYNCTIADENGCTFDVEYKVNVIFPMEVVSIVNNISCNGEKDGEIFLTITHGAKPYSILWSNGETTGDIAQLEPGDYIVDVTDDIGQTFKDTIKITEPEVLAPVFEIRDTLINELRMKIIDLTVDGGTEPYTYKWSNMFTEEDLLIPDSSATYSVIISDSRNCTDSISFNITKTKTNELDESLDLNVFPNPNNGNFEFSLSGNPSSKLEIIITAIDGKLLLHKTIREFSGFYSEDIQIPQIQGAYSLSATTPKGVITKRFIIR